MDRNVKIALGCGGAGCLGLIVVIAAGVALYFLSGNSRSTTNRNSNYNANRSSGGSESLENRNGNRNDNRGANDNESSSSSSSSSLSEDAKHKLFHAASMTRDADIIHRVGVKIGILNEDYTPKQDNVDFATDHVSWVFRNTDFIQSVDTPAKAKAYVDAHIND